MLSMHTRNMNHFRTKALIIIMKWLWLLAKIWQHRVLPEHLLT
ncbi:hypothetical protein Goshw_027928 [Gossypium schwendimanii]|uniref:Uncharacterized protein n=1 Tax=Gossypium schwendimanii TaxID=34291 RepID=A0A7J9MLI1_GOSSC|nr:hypothetical protein [Gossypium schwendimanii]